MSVKTEDVPLVECVYLVFAHMPGENYRSQIGSLLLDLGYVFQALINSLVCWFRMSVVSSYLNICFIFCCCWCARLEREVVLRLRATPVFLCSVISVCVVSKDFISITAVSYTHLTLPTTRSV